MTTDNGEAAALRRKLQLHAGDVQSLSGEVDMWRERALEAEEELARLRAEPSAVTDTFDDLCNRLETQSRGWGTDVQKRRTAKEALDTIKRLTERSPTTKQETTP